jgi:hypothetical protein
MIKDKIYLDVETADRITIDSLKDARGDLQQELEDHRKGSWLHPEDVVMNSVYIEAMTTVLRYYGRYYGE